MFHVIVKVREQFQADVGSKSFSAQFHSRKHAVNMALEETQWESTASVLVLDMTYGGLVVLAEKGDFA